MSSTVRIFLVLVAIVSLPSCGRDTNRTGGGDVNTGVNAQPPQPACVTSVAQLEAPAVVQGDYHGCARLADRSVYCWGMNLQGQSGYYLDSPDPANPGQTVQETVETPLAVPGLPAGGVDRIAAAGEFTCALAAGAVYCWGDNSYGQLGWVFNSALTLAVQPVAGLPAGITRITTGGTFACAATASQVFCWGDNTYGQLGTGAVTPASSNTPVAVVAPAGGWDGAITSIAAGDRRTCAVTSARSIYCWGDYGDAEGALVPARVPAITTPVDAVFAGGSQTCALSLGAGTAAPVLACWGDELVGPSGSVGQSGMPYPVAGTGQCLSAISIGVEHACVVSDGKALCWGRNVEGELGDGQRGGFVYPPVAVQGLGNEPAVAISTGAISSCAATASQLSCWGQGDYPALSEWNCVVPTAYAKAIPEGRSSWEF